MTTAPAVAPPAVTPLPAGAPAPAAAPLATPPAPAADNVAVEARVNTGTTYASNPVEGTEPVRKKRKPMNGGAIGVQIGVAHVGTGDVANPTYVSTASSLNQDQLRQAGLIGTAGCDITDRRCRTDARRGVHLSFPIQLGGEGVGLRLEPYMTFAPSATAYGLYTGPTFEFQVAEPLYLGFGFGLKAAWVKADNWQYAADLYGRIPVRATVYLIDQLALVFEGAFGAGASGYISEPTNITLPDGSAIARKQNVQFGFGRTWDLSIGLRFP